jgi:DNA-binding FrmR family transcriptional regulator
MDNTEVMARLQTVAVQIGEIVDWIGETDRSLEAIRYIRSIQTELHQITVSLVENHLASCMGIALAQDSNRALDALDEIRDMFRWT